MATLLEQSAPHYPRQSAIKASGINSFWHFLIFLVFHFLYPLRAERQLDTIVCHLDLEFRSHEFIYSMLLVFHKTIDMALVVENQINFPCRKMRVRRKMDFDDDLDSPTKSPRKGKSFTVELLKTWSFIWFHFIENCDTAEKTEQTVRLTRSSSRRTQTPSKPHRIRASPKNPPRNLFLNTSPSKEATTSLTLRSDDIPRKLPLRENLENQQVLHKQSTHKQAF